VTLALIGKDLWNGIPLLEKAVRTVGVYAALVLLLRIGGRRDMAQLDSFDLVVLLVLANVVQNAIIGNDTSLSGGLFGAAVAVNGIVVRTARASARGVRLFEGSPAMLVTDGRIDVRTLRRLGLRRSDVDIAVRRQGANDLDEVAKASLEPGGTIVVQLKDDEEAAKVKDLRRMKSEIDAKLDAILAATGGRSVPPPRQ
jgi:uncharacterized membrane protein YcaP (DUF421 family)